MKFTPTTIAFILASTAHLIHSAPAPSPLVDETALHPESLNCPSGGLANVAAPDSSDLTKAASRLSSKGGTCTTPEGEGSCIRVACDNTTGIWMCNTNGHGANPKSAQCKDVAAFAYRGEGDDGDGQQTIYAQCVNRGYYAVTYASGQAMAPGGDWNVIAGYANCKKSSTLAPDQQ